MFIINFIIITKYIDNYVYINYFFVLLINLNINNNLFND